MKRNVFSIEDIMILESRDIMKTDALSQIKGGTAKNEDCSCGSGNNNTGGGECTCGSANSNKASICFE
ncbi:MAG: hypothetical protein HC831_16540 [Chloroflexia bacterium]|nr:hypothetical protein [Bacteroidales bacterium]NJO90369.1 hypothetical protein [Chloroflexia bacterium]